mgnify:CR=1 FL=1
MAQTIDVEQTINDILSLQMRSQKMTEEKAKKKRSSCIEISVGTFVASMMLLTSLTTGAAVYTVMQAAQLSEARAQLSEAKEIISHLMGGKKDGKKGVGYTMRHSHEAIVHAATVCGREYNVRPDLLLAVWHVESRKDNWAINAKSRAASIGQILPSNYPELIAAGVIEQPADLLLDITKAACSSAYFLADYTRRGRGDAWAVAAYGAGPGRAYEGMEYSETVMRHVRP